MSGNSLRNLLGNFNHGTTLVIHAYIHTYIGKEDLWQRVVLTLLPSNVTEKMMFPGRRFGHFTSFSSKTGAVKQKLNEICIGQTSGEQNDEKVHIKFLE